MKKEQEQSKKTIYQKLHSVQESMGAISKDSENPFFKSKYFDINKLIEHCAPILSANNLILLQPIANGRVITQIIDIDTGERIESEMVLPTITDPQKGGSVITYYRRYTLQSLLGLQAQDDDANSFSIAEKKQFEKEIKDALKMHASEFADCKTIEDAKELYKEIMKEYPKEKFEQFVKPELDTIYKQTSQKLA